MQKTMDELAVGEMFTVNDVKYVKISDVKYQHRGNCFQSRLWVFEIS